MESKFYLIFFPLICALIGWFTNYLAVRMLFRPHKVVKFGPFRLQGLIPKRRKEVAGNIAKTVEERLISVDDIARVLQRIDWEEKIDQEIDLLVEEKLGSDLWQKLPFWSHFKDKVALPLKGILRREIAKILQKSHVKLVEKFKQNLDVHKLIFDRIDNFDLQQLEDVVLQVASRELRHIELIGALLGFFIGLLQVLIILYLA